jgi:short-subunit dehydrogenase
MQTLLRRSNKTSIRDKVVIITGASSGIGEVTAKACAEKGAHVVLVARREEVLQNIATSLAGYDGDTLVIPADVSDDDAIQHVLDAALNRFGRIDVLINNAGLGVGGYLEELDGNKLHKMIEVNLYGAIRFTQMLLPILMQQKQGTIVNISSVAGEIFAPGQAAYSATKAGLNAFSMGLRREVKQHGIHVANVMPGWTYTPMIGHISPQHLRDAWMFPPFFRVDSPEWVAEKIIEAIERKRARVFLGSAGMWFSYIMDRLYPTFMDRYYALPTVRKRAVKLMEELT